MKNLDVLILSYPGIETVTIQKIVSIKLIVWQTQGLKNWHHTLSCLLDVMHVTKSHRPSPCISAHFYCKQQKLEMGVAWEKGYQNALC